MREYLVGLCHSLEAALDNSAQNISLVCTSIELLLPPDKALAIGLIVNELVTNAFKYAFVNGGAGCVLVDLSVENGRMLLSVSDDGVGCAQEHREGLGTRLIKTFVQQLGGSVRRQEINPGCRIVVEFPA
jgi:two-component sensor histidine kinase